MLAKHKEANFRATEERHRLELVDRKTIFLNFSSIRRASYTSKTICSSKSTTKEPIISDQIWT